MKQTIRFKGLTLNRDEQSADPGELALCGDMQLYDGALRPATFAGEDVAGGKPFNMLTPRVPKLMYIHQTISKELFIYAVNNQLCYAYENNLRTDWTIPQSNSIGGNEVVVSAIKEIKSVGNTLCIMMDDHYDINNVFHRGGIYYCLFDKTDNSYKDLGYKPPFMEFVFNLNFDSEIISGAVKGDVIVHYTTDKPFEDDVDAQSGRNHIDENYQGTVTEAAMAIINRGIDKFVGKGLFYAPFLIRYCYRMYDGSMIMHSAPVLMLPTLYHPVWLGDDTFDVEIVGQDCILKASYKCLLNPCGLEYNWINCDNSTRSELDKWKDIIKSVDFFITPQFSRIDTSKKIEYMSDGGFDGEISFTDGEFFDVRDMIPIQGTYKIPELPEISEEDYFGRIRNASSFFKLASMPIGQGEIAYGNFHELEFDPSILKNITVQEQMQDDYKTHNRIIPIDKNHGGMYVYNHRLNVYGISELLFNGFSAETMFPYCKASSGGGGEIEPVDPGLIEVEGGEGEGGVGTGSNAATITMTTLTVKEVNVWLKTDAGTKKLTKTGSWTVIDWLLKNSYCFHPDDRAFAMQFVMTDDSTICRRLDSAASLNGALSFLPNKEYTPTVSNFGTDTNLAVPMPNKIYTSRADNPFYFPNLPGESGINTVGVGEINGLAVATRALSAGQVGDHDLIVFCSDGIWVLKVSAQGTYSAIHNISREVCVNKDSICQLDQSVVFATNRSLSRIVESDVLSLSDVLDGPYVNWPTVLPGLYAMFDEGGDFADAGIKRLFEFATPPIDFFRSGRVFYDYTGSRIMVIPNTEETAQNDVAMVYSIRDHAWSTMNISGIKSVIPSYPSIYVQYYAGNVQRMNIPYNYNEVKTVSDQEVPVTHNGIIVTRTLTFSDTQDVLRGFRQMTDSEKMPLLLFYGSNDQRTWNYIGRTDRAFHNYLPGHPFRFFRIAIYFSEMKTSEEYQELMLEIINKYAKL